MATEHHISVQRTARYFTLGDPASEVSGVWFACHGYGLLASEWVRQFNCIDRPGRVVVVPEALSRYYTARGAHSAEDRIGASWMTREDRDNEILDYVNYLDSVYDEIFRQIDRARARVTVLGFSQGGATATRWVERGRVSTDRLILWGSLLPNELELEKAAELFRRVPLTMVYGKKDEYADPAMLARYEAKLNEMKVPHEVITFDGSHRMDRDVLQRLAGIAAV